MAGTETRIAGRERLWRIALALLPGLVLVLLRGVDTNWDLRNYHLYNPHAWLTGRMLTDVAPAQLQSFHNPLLDLPMYLLATSGLDMRWMSLWLTLPFALAIYLLLELQARLSPARPTRLSQVVLALLAMSGAATWSTLGNSMNDGFVAAALIGSLCLLTRNDPPRPRDWVLAGLVAGAVMGLKLTASAYCLALGMAAVLVPGELRQRAVRTVSLAAGGLLGFIASYGWWGWTLFKAYGSPFFPYYNNVFRSPLLPPYDYADARFRGEGIWDALMAPVTMLDKTNVHSELFVRDPRLFLGALGTLVLLWWSRKRQASPTARARLYLVAAFYWAAYVAWALQYGIYRYATLLEMLGVLMLVVTLQHVPRLRGVALLLALVAVSIATHRPDWGHTRITTPRFAIPPAPVPADAMVVIARGEPVAYTVLGMPPGVRMVGAGNNIQFPDQCTGLQRRARAAVAAHRGPLWLLSPDVGSVADDSDLLRKHYALARAGQCWSYPTALGTTVLCPLVRTAPTPDCIPQP